MIYGILYIGIGKKRDPKIVKLTKLSVLFILALFLKGFSRILWG